MRSGDSPVNLDVHWALLPPWAKDWAGTRWLWDGAERAHIDGTEHLQLHPADLAWFALLNAAPLSVDGIRKTPRAPASLRLK